VANILIGISGGIAAYKVCDLINKLKKDEETQVIAVMTEAAQKMITVETISTLSGNEVITDMFKNNGEIEHIKKGEWADIFVVVPATANTIYKLAHGVADNFLTTSYLAAKCKKLIVPAMNVHMYEAQAVQRNLDLIEEDGAIVLEPDEGKLACGVVGVGKLPKVPIIYKAIKETLYSHIKDKKLNVLITSGGTSEYIDDVRILTNISTGKFGAVIASKFRNSNITYIHGKNAIMPEYTPISSKLNTIQTTSTQDLYEAMKSSIPNMDIAVHAMAVSDFGFKKNDDIKLSSNDEESFVKYLKENIIKNKKIIAEIKTWNPSIFLVGFKFTVGKISGDLIATGYDALIKNNADIVVANDKKLMNIAKSHRGVLIRKDPKTKLYAEPFQNKEDGAIKLISWIRDKYEKNRHALPLHPKTG